MHRHALRCRELHLHVRLVQLHAVIARCDGLVVVREFHFALSAVGHRDECHVAQLADTRAAEVHVAETYQDGVAVVVARGPVPPASVLVRSHLHQSPWHVGTEKDMTVSARSDALVDEAGKVLCTHGYAYHAEK